jgi:hypothetical protein
MTTDSSATHHHPENRANEDVLLQDAPHGSTRPEALLELARTLKKLRELCAELSHNLPADAVETVLKETFPDFAEPPPDERNDVSEAIQHRKYGEAERQLNEEKEQYLGLADVIKHLLLWEESPEERLQKNVQKEAGD